MFPRGTVQSGLPGIAISQGTTKIRFPAPGAISSSSASTHKRDVTHTLATFGFAYVNDLARESMFGKGTARFPTGSIIVREKLSTPTAPSPDVLVVMVKREKGFNSKANDWEFLTVSGDLKKIEKREKEGKCQQCHASEAKNDFVFRYPMP
jgi:Cytochrome P460